MKTDISLKEQFQIFSLGKRKKWFTPSLDCGILPGIFRDYFKSNLQYIEECELTIPDLIYADEVILTNSLRGAVWVDEVYSADGELIKMFKTESIL